MNYLIATSGPVDWSAGANWSQGTAPATAEDCVVENSALQINAGLAQAAVALALLRIPMTFTGQLGVTGHSGAYLAIGASRAILGEPGRGAATAVGSGLVKVDFGSTTPCECMVMNTKDSGVESGLEPLRILGNHANHALTVLGGRVGVATSNPAETAQWPTISLAGGTLGLGAGVTWSSLYQTGGELELASGGTTLTQTAGILATRGTGAITTLTLGGAATLLGRAAAGATIGTLEILPGGVCDLGHEAITITTLRLHKGATLRFSRANPGMLTVTNAIEYLGGAGEIVAG